MSRETQHMWRLAGRYSAVGIEMVASLALGGLAGSWLDGRLGSAPVGLLVGCALGTAAAARAILRIVRQSQRGDADL